MSAKWRRSRRKALGLRVSKNRKQDQHIPWIKGSKNRESSRSCKHRSVPVSRRRLREPEPLVDIVDEKEEIIVFAEFAGFNTKSPRIDVKHQRMTLSAEGADRKYYKCLNLPKEVIPDTVHTSYKNGVLEIHFKKAVKDSIKDKAAG